MTRPRAVQIYSSKRSIRWMNKELGSRVVGAMLNENEAPTNWIREQHIRLCAAQASPERYVGMYRNMTITFEDGSAVTNFFKVTDYKEDTRTYVFKKPYKKDEPDVTYELKAENVKWN